MDKEKMLLTDESINDIKELIKNIDPDNEIFSQTKDLIDQLDKKEKLETPPVKINLPNKDYKV